MKLTFERTHRSRCSFVIFLLVCISQATPIPNTNSTNETLADTDITINNETEIYVDLELPEAMGAALKEISLFPGTSDSMSSTPVVKQRMQQPSLDHSRNFSSAYEFKLFAAENIDSIQLDETIEKLIQLAILKHFNQRSNDLVVKLVANKLLLPASVQTSQVIFEPSQIHLSSTFKISTQNITAALIEFSFNEHKCSLENDSHSIACRSAPKKDAQSLLNFIDFWIQLTDSNIREYTHRTGKLVCLMCSQV